MFQSAFIIKGEKLTLFGCDSYFLLWKSASEWGDIHLLLSTGYEVPTLPDLLEASRVVKLVHHRKLREMAHTVGGYVTIQRTGTVWRNRLARTSWSSTKENAKSLTKERTSPCANTGNCFSSWLENNISGPRNSSGLKFHHKPTLCPCSKESQRALYSNT